MFDQSIDPSISPLDNRMHQAVPSTSRKIFWSILFSDIIQKSAYDVQFLKIIFLGHI